MRCIKNVRAMHVDNNWRGGVTRSKKNDKTIKRTEKHMWGLFLDELRTLPLQDTPGEFFIPFLKTHKVILQL